MTCEFPHVPPQRQRADVVADGCRYLAVHLRGVEVLVARSVGSPGGVDGLGGVWVRCDGRTGRGVVVDRALWLDVRELLDVPTDVSAMRRPGVAGGRVNVGIWVITRRGG